MFLYLFHSVILENSDVSYNPASCISELLFCLLAFLLNDGTSLQVPLSCSKFFFCWPNVMITEFSYKHISMISLAM
jgi:hypothetical protein